MRRILGNARRQEDLERDGFVQLPLLGAREIDLLREHYGEITEGRSVANSDYGVFVSLQAQPDRERRRTLQLLRELIVPRVGEHFVGVATHVAGYWSKLPDPRSHVVPHQDWTFVNPAHSDTCWLTLWIALGDYTPRDGTLGFIRGSHRFFDDIICSPTRLAVTPTRGHGDLLFRYLEFPRLRAGDALAFTSQTIHGSLPNLGPGPRICAGIGITPSHAEIRHYFMKPGTKDRMLELAVDEDFLLEYSDDLKLCRLWEVGRIPSGVRVVEELPATGRIRSAAEIEALCLRHANVRQDPACP